MEPKERHIDDRGDTCLGVQPFDLDDIHFSETDHDPAYSGADDDHISPDDESSAVPRDEPYDQSHRSYATIEDDTELSYDNDTRNVSATTKAIDCIPRVHDKNAAETFPMDPPTTTKNKKSAPPMPTSQVTSGRRDHHTAQMTDLEAQHVLSQPDNKNGPVVATEASTTSTPPPPLRPVTDQDSNRMSFCSYDDDEQVGLFNLSEELRSRDPPTEPWFLEMTRLRRIYILWLNKQLALCRKSILQRERASDDDMKTLGKVLHLQGKIMSTYSSQCVIDKPIAEAIRDFQSVRALDYLTAGEKEELKELTAQYLRKTAASNFADVDPFETENYRRLQPDKQAVVFDGVREMLRVILPKQISWTQEEKVMRKQNYEEGYKPEILSSSLDRLARFIVAMGGALFILVPMYIMALHQNPAKNLITTTVAVVLFALVCSIPLGLANDQTFSVTVGYAAVLMVFVGLTSSPK